MGPSLPAAWHEGDSAFRQQSGCSLDPWRTGSSCPGCADIRPPLAIKAVEKVVPVDAKQLLTYLRVLQQALGLLLNFSGETMTEGIQRFVNDHRPTS